MRTLVTRYLFPALLIAIVAVGCEAGRPAPSVSPTNPASPTNPVSPINSVSPLASGSPLPTVTSPLAAPPTGMPAAAGKAAPQEGLRPGMGGAKGIVRSATGRIPEGTQVYAAQFVWNAPKTEGVFFLDPAEARGVPVESSGSFQVLNLAPGDYVFVVGTKPELAAAILGQGNQPRVVNVQAGKIVDLGEQTLSLQ